MRILYVVVFSTIEFSTIECSKILNIQLGIVRILHVMVHSCNLYRIVCMCMSISLHLVAYLNCGNVLFVCCVPLKVCFRRQQEIKVYFGVLGWWTYITVDHLLQHCSINQMCASNSYL